MTPCSSPIREPIKWEYEIGFPLAKPKEEKPEEPIVEEPIE